MQTNNKVTTMEEIRALGYKERLKAIEERQEQLRLERVETRKRHRKEQNRMYNLRRKQNGRRI